MAKWEWAGSARKQHIPKLRLITQQAGSWCHDLTHISEVTLWWLQYPQPEMAKIAFKEVMPKLWKASLQVHGNCVTFFFLRNIQRVREQPSYPLWKMFVSPRDSSKDTAPSTMQALVVPSPENAFLGDLIHMIQRFLFIFFGAKLHENFF